MRTLKLTAGIILIAVGFLALVTPLTPGAWLMFVGLELIGIRLAASDRIKQWIKEKRLHFRNWNARDAKDPK